MLLQNYFKIETLKVAFLSAVSEACNFCLKSEISQFFDCKC